MEAISCRLKIFVRMESECLNITEILHVRIVFMMQMNRRLVSIVTKVQSFPQKACRPVT